MSKRKRIKITKATLFRKIYYRSPDRTVFLSLLFDLATASFINASTFLSKASTKSPPQFISAFFITSFAAEATTNPLLSPALILAFYRINNFSGRKKFIMAYKEVVAGVLLYSGLTFGLLSLPAIGAERVDGYSL